MSLRKIAKILGISPTYLSLLLNGKRPWRGNLKERYEELVNTFVNTNNSLPETPSYSSIQAVYQLPAIKSWREREGVEPTAPTEGPGPTDLKSAKPTGTHPLPRLRSTRGREALGSPDPRFHNKPAIGVPQENGPGAFPPVLDSRQQRARRPADDLTASR